MPPQSSSGWVPPRGWFYALAGLVVVETLLLANTFWRRPDPPRVVFVQQAAPPTPPPIIPAPPSPVLAGPDAEDPSIQPDHSPLARALRTRPSLRRTHRFEDLGASLSKTDPRAALRVLGQLPPGDHLAFVRGMFDTLGQGDRHAAVSVVREITDARERSTALATLLESWRGDPTGHAATAQAPNGGTYDASAWGLQLLADDPVDVDLVRQWADELTTGEGRAALLGGLAGKLLQINPAGALAYGDGLDDDGRTAFVENFFSSLPKDWLKNQPQDVLAWSNQLVDPALREAVAAQLFRAWIAQDPRAAAQAATTLPAGDERQGILRAAATRLAATDTASADNLVQTLSGRDRDVVSAAVDAMTPVGIGAALGTDQDGNFVVQSLMDNMPAALSGQIHPGDRLIGIVRPNGELVKTSDLDLAQTINLVRGLPFSTVQLQVVRPLSGGGFSAPTTVTLVRQRITRG